MMKRDEKEKKNEFQNRRKDDIEVYPVLKEVSIKIVIDTDRNDFLLFACFLFLFLFHFRMYTYRLIILSDWCIKLRKTMEK